MTHKDHGPSSANWPEVPSGKFAGASHSVKSSVPRALAGVKNDRLTLRATEGYCFSPLFGLLRTSPGFAALQAGSLKDCGSKGDSGKFPCKTRVPERLGFKSPLSAMAKIINVYAGFGALLLFLP
jgi:hypothetical protein